MSGPPYTEYWADTIDLTTRRRRSSAMFAHGGRGRRDRRARVPHRRRDGRRDAAPFTVCIDDVQPGRPEVRKAQKRPSTRRRRTCWSTRSAICRRCAKLAHGQERVDRAARVGAARSRAAQWSPAGETKPVGQGRRVGRGRARRRLLVVHDARQGLHAEGRRRRRATRSTSRRDLYQHAEVRRARVSSITTAAASRSRCRTPAEAMARPRPAGHLSVDAQHGRRGGPVRCGLGCDYTLDVTGGWYDAGDHGKYVVNGGISVWTLLNQYERAQLRAAPAPTFGDGKLEHPGEEEQGARHPRRGALGDRVHAQDAGARRQPHAGMVHHKIHDEEWTALGMRPARGRAAALPAGRRARRRR